MNLLKVICNTAAGNTVFDFNAKPGVYDWDQSTLLVDCISQVFYNTTPTWSGNIEVYFELLGKNYCAGRKMHGGKSNNYLAGEVKGKLLLLAFDNDSMHSYLDDELGCDFNIVLERCLVSQINFERFCGDPNVNHFGMIREAMAERQLVFDLGEVERLTAKTAKITKKSDVDAAKDKFEVAEGELAELTAQRDALHKSLDEMKALEEKNRSFEEARKNAEALEARADEIAELERMLENSGKAKEIVETLDALKEKEKELDALQQEDDEDDKKLVALVYAQKKKEENDAIRETNAKREQLLAERQAKSDEKGRVEKQIAELEKQKAEAEKPVEEPKPDEAVVARKQELVKRCEEIEKEKSKLSRQAEQMAATADDAVKKEAVAKQESAEIAALNYKQGDYNRDEAAKREQQAVLNAPAPKDNSEELQSGIDGINKNIESLEQESALLAAEGEVIDYDLAPEHKLQTTKKYFGRGETPMGVDRKRKELAERREEINAKLEGNAALCDQYRQDAERLLQELEALKASKAAPAKQKPTPIVTVLDGNLTPAQQAYREALKQGKGDDFAREKAAEVDKAHTEAENAKKQTADADKKLKAYDDEKANLEKQVAELEKKAVPKKPEPKKFDGQDKLDKLNERRHALDKEIAVLDEKIPDEVAQPEAAEKDDVPVAVVPLVAELNGKRDENKKKIDDLKEQCAELRGKLEEKESNYGKPAAEAEKDVLSDEAAAEKQRIIDDYKTQKVASDEALANDQPLPDDFSEKLAALNAETAEADNAVMDKQQDVEKLNNKYENKKKALKDFNDNKKALAAALAAVEAVKNRQFRSNTEADEYLVKYDKQADLLLKKLTNRRLGLEIGEELKVLDRKGNPVEWSGLESDDKLMVYIACAQSVPKLDGVTADWLLVDGSIPVEREKVDKAFDLLNVPHKFKLVFTPKEDDEAPAKAETNAQPEENAQPDATPEAPVEAEGEATVEDTVKEVPAAE